MLDIIALIFICKYVGRLALRKGLKPGTWKINTVLGWFGIQIIALAAGILLLNSRDLIGLQLLGWICSIGSFLVIRYILQNKPDITPDEDINRIGVDDLKP